MFRKLTALLMLLALLLTACAETAPASTVNVGDYVTFGSYPQGENGEVEPIEWLVLDVQDGKALLLSRYGLDVQKYNTKWTDVTWETCSLRAWLNDSFLNTAFTAEEQKSILLTDVDNSAAQGYSVYGATATSGNDTPDRIFLLSYKEANTYLGVTYNNHDNLDSRVQPTAYARNRGAGKSSSYNTADGAAAGLWWLRSPGTALSNAANVDYDGALTQCGVHNISGSVRPALWLDLES